MKKLKEAIAEYERLLRLKAKYNMAIHATLNETGAFSGKLQFLNKSEGQVFIEMGAIFNEDSDNLHDALVCAVTRLDEKIEPLLKLADEALK